MEKYSVIGVTESCLMFQSSHLCEQIFANAKPNNFSLKFIIM